MASNLQVRTEQPPAHTPLLTSNSNQNDVEVGQGHQEARQDEPEEPEETQLDQMLRRLETFLLLLGFKQSSLLSVALSWASFAAVGVVVPVAALQVGGDCYDCENDQRKDFEMIIVAFQACLAAVSLLCLSHNLRKCDLRRFLFVDRYSGKMASFHESYVKQISVSKFKFLSYLHLACAGFV